MDNAQSQTVHNVPSFSLASTMPITVYLVMKLGDEAYSAKARTLRVGSALTIVNDYCGELYVSGNLTLQ